MEFHKRFLPLILLIIVTALFLFGAGYQSNLLLNKNYLINKKDLIQLDSIKMLSQSFYTDSKSRSGHKFQDETYKTFIIEGAPASAVEDDMILRDSLRNCDLVMTIFTDSAGGANYFNQKNSEKIQVIGLLIQGKPYINFDKINPQKRSIIIRAIWLFSLLYVGFLIAYFRRNKISWN